MDCSHNFGSDLSLSASGDLLMADGSDYTQQRVLRRLLTNPRGYVWQPTYGAGLPGFVGQVANAPRLTALILRQMKRESRVAQQPLPVVAVSVTPNGVTTASITYVDVATGTTQTVTP